MDEAPASPYEDERLRNLVLVVYVLYGVAVVAPVTALVGVIICHLKQGEALGTVYQSHMQWLIRTFWWTLLLMVISWITVFVGIGFVLMTVAGVWYIYRTVKGFLRFNDRRPIENAEGWF